jgi:hypothetical protein
VAERVALNFLQRMSGIASLTRQMVDAVQVEAALWLLLSLLRPIAWKQQGRSSSLLPRSSWAAHHLAAVFMLTGSSCARTGC